MKRNFFITFTTLLIGVSLVGCGKSNMEGIILEVTENEILLAENLSLDKYEEIKNKSITMIQEEEGDIRLIFLTYDNTDEWEKGDEVTVWIEGGVNESLPAQAEAKKVSYKK